MPTFDRDDVLASMQGRFADFYSQYGPLHPSGGELRGACPIHGGQRDSFAVDNEGRWFCHSECSAGGDVFEFLSRKEGLDFPDALAVVAGWSGTASLPSSASFTKPNSSKPTRPARRIIKTYDYHDEHGTLLFQVVRYEPKGFSQRRPADDGTWVYSLEGGRRVLYRLPEITAAVANGEPVYICEGEKDADALAALGWCATTAPMGAKKWDRAYTEALCGASVVILPDNDRDGQEHARIVAKALHGKAKRVRVVNLPGLLEKNDVSNWLAAGGTAAQLSELSDLAPEWKPNENPSGGNMHEGEPSAEIPYQETRRGLVWQKQTRDGIVATLLTNFTARIEADVIEDDGAESRRLFEIVARCSGRQATFSLPAASFAAMNWPAEHLGAGAIVFPGLAAKDNSRVAIQLLSGDPPLRHVFAHTGWREVAEGNWHYLHAGGTIGTGTIGTVGTVSEGREDSGKTSDVGKTNDAAQVRLSPALERFCLPETPTGEDAAASVRTSLSLLALLPDALSFSLLGATYRAALGTADFSVFLAGPSGAFKSEAAALFQQHFGAGLDARHLPAAWSSTDNFLEGLAFTAKDALLVIDDFAPTGTAMDVQRLHSKADRVLRGQGNNAARGRMRADGTLRATKPPRGLILSTGEDVPQGVSLRGRMCILELTPGDIHPDALTQCQADAASGVYASAMSAFLSWLAPRYGETRAQVREETTRLRTEAASSHLHRRTPEITASLAVGLRYFLRFAISTGAIDKAEAKALWARGWAALGAAAEAQMRHQAASEPTLRFLELVSAALASGKAHVAGMDGKAPIDPTRWGWRQVLLGTGEFERLEWREHGERIGWVDGEDLYLQPDAAFGVAKKLGGESGDGLSIGAKTLSKRLNERGLLATTDESRDRLTVRKMIAGNRQTVLHLHSSSLLSGKPSQSAQSSHSEPGDTPQRSEPEANGPKKWDGFSDQPQESAHKTGPFPPQPHRNGNGAGPIGTVGPVFHTQDTVCVERMGDSKNRMGDANVAAECSDAEKTGWNAKDRNAEGEWEEL